MNTAQRDKQRDAERFQWALLVGGLLGNSGYAKQVFSQLETCDAPSDWLAAIMAAIRDRDAARVYQLVLELTAQKPIEGESSLQAVLRKVHSRCLHESVLRSKSVLSHHIGGSPEEFVAELRRHADMIEAKVNGHDGRHGNH